MAPPPMAAEKIQIQITTEESMWSITYCVDGIGIMDGGLSSRSTRRTNQMSAADEDDVAIGSRVDVPKILLAI